MAQPLGRQCARRCPSVASGVPQRWLLGLARMPCWVWAWTGSTTPRASKNACWPWKDFWSASLPTPAAFSFVQMAAPSRTLIEALPPARRNRRSEPQRADFNQRFGEGAYQPIILLRAHHEPPQVFRYYRAADLCYVSSLHDGMNLVAKEFAAARDDERGVLALEPVHPARARNVRGLVVNPYDLEEASAAMARALAMSRRRGSASACARCAPSWRSFNVYRWAGRMFDGRGSACAARRLFWAAAATDISSLRRLPK